MVAGDFIRGIGGGALCENDKGDVVTGIMSESTYAIFIDIY